MSDFEIVTIDPSEVLDRTLTTMEEYVGEALYPGDERRIFAEAMVAVHAQLANIMMTHSENAWASPDFLEHRRTAPSASAYKLRLNKT